MRCILYSLLYIINYKGFDMCVWNNLNVIHVRALINNSYHKRSKCTNFKIIFFAKSTRTPTCFDLTWSSSRSYMTSIKHIWKHGWVIKYIKICPLNVCGYKINCIPGQNWFVRCGGCRIIDFTMVYQEDIRNLSGFWWIVCHNLIWT
jgi:hypothetical protein